MIIISFQIIPDIPEPTKPTPQVTALEKLFKDIAGEDMEVDWMELKRILDHSMREGLFPLCSMFILL